MKRLLLMFMLVAAVGTAGSAVGEVTRNGFDLTGASIPVGLIERFAAPWFRHPCIGWARAWLA